MDATTLEQAALHLPLADRAKLAQSLLLSLENLTDTELSDVWLDEAQRRAAEIDGGAVTLVSAEEVRLSLGAIKTDK